MERCAKKTGMSYQGGSSPMWKKVIEVSVNLFVYYFQNRIELTHFCYDASEEYGIFKSSQTVRNCINKCEKNKLIQKDSKNKKLILINEDIKVQTEGNILLDYKILGR